MYKVSPLVSIIIPVFNGSNYISEAIDSALNQTYKKVEVIVVNDGSTDNGATREICKSYGDRIIYHEKKNGGVSSALNLGIGKMRGEYFSWLSHDDRYLPQKIERNLDIIQKSGNPMTIPFGNYAYIDRRGKRLKVTYVKEGGDRSGVYSVMMGNLNGLTLLIHKSLIDEVGGFDENLPTIQDYDLFFKLAIKYNKNFFYDRRVLVETRIHPLQQGTKKYKFHISQSDDFFSRCIEVVNDEMISKDRFRQSKAWYRIAYRYLRNNYKNSFKHAILRARSVEINKLTKALFELQFFAKRKVVYPIWLFLFNAYKKIRGLA